MRTLWDVIVSADLMARHDRPGPRYTSYPTALEFSDAFGAAEYDEHLRRAAGGEGPLSLYTHLPFCEARCLYCACTVVITRQERVAAPYLERVMREVDMVHERVGSDRPVSQFHLGGGTPTYYAPERLAELLEHYRRRFRFTSDAEMAVEVDPRVTSVRHLEVLAEAGVNRLSFGVQDFDERVQEAVHRVQSVEQTAHLMERARALGIGALNVDLIYGLPHQTAASFARTVDTVVGLAPTRLAVYSFAYVPWVKPHQQRLDRDAMPTGLAKYEVLLAARERLLDAGYVDIGMDHFARPDDELCVAQRERRLSRTFMGYTTDVAPDQIGIGLSAIGFVAGAYVQHVKKLNQYERAIDEGRFPVERGLVLTGDDLLRQAVIRDWMCHFEIDKRAIERRFGIDFDATFADELQRLGAFDRDGFVSLGDDRIEATGLGRTFARNVAMVFDVYLERDRPADRPRFSRTV
jgi:oxygen-independent coproporphyrinogen III oxidase